MHGHDMPSGGHKLILAVVDDDQAVRSAVGRLLRACGHDVHVFDSAEAYLLERAQADCVILDVHLPGISGVELEGRMRWDDRPVPVVFITGHDDHATRDVAGTTPRPFLRKPFDADVLLAAIASATQHEARVYTKGGTPRPLAACGGHGASC
jgi:FixJ family two-component response regulator